LWAGRVARMRVMYIILIGNLKGKDHSKDLGVDGLTILECLLEK